jgi:hypothetical protein
VTDFVHTTRCRVEDNGRGGRKLVPYDEKEFRWMLLRYDPGTDILLATKQYRAKHSPSQRGYLHGVVLKTIADHIGEDDPREIYSWAKKKFNPKIVVGKDGQEEYFAGSLKESDTKEMTEFIDKIIRWAGTFLGLTIPPPDRTMTSGAGI